MHSADLCYLPATTLADLIRTREVSPVEVVDAVLARIETVNPRLNAYCTVAADQARVAARDAEARLARGEAVGPLHGVPVSFKDMTPTAGIRTTWGSLLFEHHVPRRDALSVQRTKAAGGIVLGKTNTPEFGCKGVTDNRVFGVTRNPWDPALTPGGSSGGAAAAVASGLGPLAEGSDFAGSVRIPAAACGVVGFKPSPGRLPKVEGNPWNTIPTSGPLAQTVRDAALFFDVLAGPDERDPMSLPAESFLAACDQRVGRLRVAWSVDLGYAAVDPRVAAIVEEAARAFVDLGCDLDEAHPGFPDPIDVVDDFGSAMYAAWLGPRLAEWADRMTPNLVRSVRRGQSLSATDYLSLYARRAELYRSVATFFERYDLLLTPTIAVLPFPVDGPEPNEIAGRAVDRRGYGWIPFTYPFNLTGHPAISVPAGWTDDGLPVGLQIVGPRHGDAMVLRAAAAFEAARPWVNRWPPI
jgi:Asp-tRNA(Asn)/Glu-tRNA(Gln) amidotransferase A subunit family amidase